MTLTIAKKILIGFGLVVALTLGVGGYGLVRLADVRSATEAITEQDVQTLELLREINRSEDGMKALMERSLARHLMAEQGLTSEDPLRVQAQWRDARERTEALLSRLESSSLENARVVLSREREIQWGKIQAGAVKSRAALQAVSDAVEETFELVNRGELTGMAARVDRLDRLRQESDATIDENVALTEEMVRLGVVATTDVYEEARASILVVLVLAVFVAVVAAVSLQRSITRPLTSFVHLVERVGEGDLTQRAQSTDGDELGRLGQSLNLMVTGLGELAGRTRSTTADLNSASSEILASTQQQSASASEQSAAVQQTTTTMEEVSQSAAQVADRAQRVATAAEAASSSSQAGRQAVQNMTRTMHSIREQAEAVAGNIIALSERTQAVGEIIATVNDIAEQSNLLALNASIEAAAEGENGHRFAVVAREMKNLAGQAKEATVQVRGILGEIQKGIHTSVMQTEEAVKRIESGKQQSEVVEATIRELSGSIEESVSAFEQIVASAGQQRIGFEQVAGALKNIRQATEQNAAGTQQLEQSAASLAALAQDLQKSVERYTL